MDIIYKRIKERREYLGLTQEELAAMLGYRTRSSINKIEQGINDIPRSKIIEFAEALKTSPQFLMGWIDDSENAQFPDMLAIEIRQVPLLGAIAAGEPIYAEENFQYYVEIGVDIKADFALRVKGNSMINARIHDGDIVFIRKQKRVENGEIAAVMVDGEATLKRFRRIGDMVILSAENPAYKDMVIQLNEENNIHIIGKAVAFQSDVR